MSASASVASVDAETIAWTERLHAVVDQVAAPVALAHAGKLACRAGCTGCCTDGLTVFEVEAAVIAASHAELLANGEPNPEGACAFLDEAGSCRVYASRPYVCRTQGLPLRWLEEDEQGEPIEARDICPLNLDGGEGLESLPPEACWTIGPFEQRLAERQAKLDGGEGRRVALRSLFARTEDGKRRLPLADKA